MREIAQPHPDRNKTWRWYNGPKKLSVPYWIEKEAKKRKTDPKLDYTVTSIQINFMTPDGDEEGEQFYIHTRRPLQIEDLWRAVQFTEDRFLCKLKKNEYLQKIIDQSLKDVDINRIRLAAIKKGTYKRAE